MAGSRQNSGGLVCLWMCLICWDQLAAQEIPQSLPSPMISVTSKQPDGSQLAIVGRIHVEAQDGSLMLEDQTGRIHSLLPAEIIRREQMNVPFSLLPTDEMSDHLLRSHGDTFRLHETDHFLLCSDASEIYTAYCGRLLEAVMSKYTVFFEDTEVKLVSPSAKMQVVIFRNSTTFSEHARKQHPETDFANVPGYYSIRDNQMLVTAVSGDRQFRRESDLVRELKQNPRQVETIVHESIHQLAFNTGLQVRYAPNPMWLSEGLAVYFEATNGSGSLAWSRPGQSSRVHLPTLKRLRSNDALPIELNVLLSNDAAFQSADQTIFAYAYAESWALTHFLVTRHRAAFDRLLVAYQSAKPLQSIAAEQHLERFESIIEANLDEVSSDLRRHFGRLRVPR